MIRLFLVMIIATLTVGDDHTHRVMDGYIAGPNQFTFVVGISKYTSTGYSNWCTGSIIDAKWILTAGHCVDNIDANTKLAIYSRNGYEKDPVYHPILKFVQHPDYNLTQLDDEDYVNCDLALLELEKELDFANVNVSKADLPCQGDNAPSASTYAEIAGFGRTRDAVEPKYLYAGTVKVKKCASYYFPSTICVSFFSANICKGDSGGPLIVNERKVVGVASTSSSPYCDTTSLTAHSAYAQVSANVKWIEGVTGLNFHSQCTNRNS